MSLTAIELLDLMEDVIDGEEEKRSEKEKLQEWSPEYNDQYYGDEEDFSDEEDYDDEDYATDEWGDDEEEDDWEDEDEWGDEEDAYDYYGESMIPKQVKIRGGKLVKIAAHQKRRMTSKQKMALAAARKRAHTGMANRQRAKSMKVRAQKGM